MDRIIEKKRWNKKKIFRLSSVIAIALIIILFLIFRDNSSKVRIDPTHISISVVKKGSFQEFIPIDGVIHPKHTVFIDAVQGGFVEELFVEDGAFLVKGDTILKLSNANMELDYMNRESQMYDVINNLQNSKLTLEQNRFIREKEIVELESLINASSIDFRRKKGLWKDKMISDQDYEDAERDYKTLKKRLSIAKEMKRIDSIANIQQMRSINASIERMRTNLEFLKKNLENLYVRAPINGQLSSFTIEIGENKVAGERLGQIDDTSGYIMRANIDERYVNRVFIGQGAEFDYAGQTFYLKIKKIYTQVTNGAFQVDMSFNDSIPADIKRGQTLQVRLQFSSPTEAIMVKRGGFFQETGGNWVYVIDPTGEMAVKRNTRIGRQNTNYYEVLEGLKPGEKVIVSAYDAFGEKDKLIFKTKLD
jgi:HlyD family secretion protein